jgi:hypothetical protein
MRRLFLRRLGVLAWVLGGQQGRVVENKQAVAIIVVQERGKECVARRRRDASYGEQICRRKGVWGTPRRQYCAAAACLRHHQGKNY